MNLRRCARIKYYSAAPLAADIVEETMFAYAAYGGNPTYSCVVNRQRLASLIGGAGERAVVLAAPTGFGKTLAAAQYAEQQDLPVAWVSAGGAPAETSRVLRSIVSVFGNIRDDAMAALDDDELVRATRLGVAERCPLGALLVLDDLGEARVDDAMGVVLECIDLLRHLRPRCILTTRQEVEGDRRVLVIGPSHLAFTLPEAAEAAMCLGRDDLGLDDVEQLRFACSGHPALTTMMLASSASGATFPALDEAKVIAERVALQHLSGEERRLLSTLQLLRRATPLQLSALGLDLKHGSVASVLHSLPLVRRESFDGGSVSLVAHDILCDEAFHDFSLSRLVDLEIEPLTFLSVLAENGEVERLVIALGSHGMEGATSRWLLASPDAARHVLGPKRVLDTLDRMPLGTVVNSPRLMALWTSVLYELGRVDESIPKARVAMSLAEHEGDLETLGSVAALLIRSLAVTHCAEEALELGNGLAARLEAMSDKTTFCEVLAATEVAASILDRDSEIDWIVQKVTLARHQTEGVRRAIRKMETTRACRIGFNFGDWRRVSEALLPMINCDSKDDPVTRTKRRGNVSSCLVECGRLHRAKSILETILDKGSEFADGAYMPVRGMYLAAMGELQAGIAATEEGIRLTLRGGDELDAAHDRLYLAIMQRAEGSIDDSLVTSERAYEGFSRTDLAGLRRLAVVEVAASLLALGDVSGCRAWMAQVLETGFGDNGYHRLRSALVLSECCRLDGEGVGGIVMLRELQQEVRSENSNWQLAMYVRTFPHLLGMLAMAVGARNLPSHMLRMVLPENVERSLRVARAFMDDEEWMALGQRALGEERFAEYLERKGRPICRVRVFGGLEVSTDERTIRERDWTKRKGRLVFAMLAILRGQEIPRDLILEQLWPEMDATRAKNNFYVAWSTMKAALMSPDEKGGRCPYIENSKGRCRVVREWVRSDVDDFEELMAQARTAEAEGRARDAITAYGELMSVYRGDLLPGDVYDDWFSPYRDKYRFEFIDSMARATELLLELDDPWEALVFARRGLCVDPFREDLYQAALRCHIAAGQRSAAIETYIQCKSQLADELGLDPSGSTMELYQQVLAMEERPRTEHYGISEFGVEF